jgi:8-oxo-dGTP pyrophosphatase MutT (NUDIX family)
MLYKSKKLVCLNCDTQGHAFKKCKLPVRSYGIIAFKMNGGVPEYLLIQRKDTIGYTDFMRGKYSSGGIVNSNKLRSLVEEMTDDEKTRILGRNFDDLWGELWLEHSGGIFSNEKYCAKAAFNRLDRKSIIRDSFPSRYTENEWGFPKGRKNLMENGVECALREFREETSLNSDDFKLLSDIPPLVEEFTASDGNKYTHIYYLAIVKDEVSIDITKMSNSFLQEVKAIGFFDYKTSYKMFRDYDVKKRYVLTLADKLLKNLNVDFFSK